MTIKKAIPDLPDDPDLFKSLMQRPHIAWPTVAILLAAFTLFGLTIFAYAADVLSLAWAVTFNSIATYLAFTPIHDATHNAVSSNRSINDWVGRLGTTLLSPVPFFRTFRYMHMQHHRFTNDEEKDPDMYCGSGPVWLLPFKWATLEFNYFRLYLAPETFNSRPASERRELFLGLCFGITVLAIVIWMGWLPEYLLLFLVPTRIANYFLSIAFDFLPHYPHDTPGKDDPFRSTSNRVGMEWLLTPLLLFQNYHLVHHLYPTAPFYRNLKLWNARRQYHESKNPAITDTFSLRPREG